MEFIESLGNLSGAEIKVISVGEGLPNSSANYTTIRFEAVGTWEEVFKTISLVDHISAALSISDMDISRNRVVTMGKTSILEWSAIINTKVLKLRI